MITKSNNDVELFSIYKEDKDKETREVFYRCSFEGMNIDAEIFKTKSKKTLFAVLIKDEKENNSRFSIEKNSKFKSSYSSFIAKECTKNKITFNRLVLGEVEFLYEKDAKDWKKDACSKVIAYDLLSTCGGEVTTEKINELSKHILESFYIPSERIKAQNKIKDDAAEKLSEITKVPIFKDPLSVIINCPSLRYNIIKYDEQLFKRFKEYEEGMSMQDFLQKQFGDEAVELAKKTFGLN